jgi:uncharacterized protein YkwD
MKRKGMARTAIALGLAGIMLLSTGTAAMASDTPEVERTKAWDSIRNTLGGTPESVRKVEYEGSVFYLNEAVTDADFLTVLEAGPEAVRMKPPKENGKLYSYPVYILWNSDKTVLLVHPIIFDYDKTIEDAAVPADPPASLTGAQTPSVNLNTALTDEQAYMLSAEYTEAVRTEFYRLLNEHRAANGADELEIDLELQGYADIRADEQRIRFGHTRPDGSKAGSGWHDSKNNVNTRYAENALTAGALSSDPANTALGIFSRWKNSEGHNWHMLYDFDSHIKMGFGLVPVLDDDGFVISGAIFATGY